MSVLLQVMIHGYSCVDLSFCWLRFDTGTSSLLQNMLLIIKDKLSSSLSSSSGLRTTKQQCPYIMLESLSLTIKSMFCEKEKVPVTNDTWS